MTEEKPKEPTYVCAVCKGEFSFARDDAEALAESKELYGDLAKGDLAIVCDNCAKGLT